MIYTQRPEIFNPIFEVVSCFIEDRKDILLLLRQDDKPQPNTYGIPAGKVNPNEDLRKAIIRETKEETSLDLFNSRLFYIGKLYVKYADYDFIYHTFKTLRPKNPNVSLNKKEHKSHMWINPEKALSLPLIQDLDACIKLFYGL